MYNIKTIILKFKSDMLKHIFFALALISAVCSVASSVLHYTSRNYGNDMVWIGWILGMTFLMCSFLFSKHKKKKKKKLDRKKIAVFLLISAFFILSHLWNFETAPWNQNGLFDDAAWNVYFTQSYVMEGEPFQGAVHESIHPNPRETIFHYYLNFVFGIFGYNVLVFNLSVMFLGFLAYLFTILLVHELFKRYTVTIMSAILMNFIPLHFIFSFVGQRYAIIPPLMMSSVYFLYRGFAYRVKRKSKSSIAFSSILAGLCFSGAIMGRQYIMGLAGAVFLYVIFHFRKSFTERSWSSAKIFIIGFLISSIPLLMYIYYHTDSYFANESKYMTMFIDTIRRDGMDGFLIYYNRMKDCLFGVSGYKWFISEYPIIPIAFYIFLLPGLIIAAFKRHYLIIVLTFIAPLGAFISGFSDYRVLMSCPLWVVAMSFTIDAMTSAAKPGMIKLEYFRKFNFRMLARAAAIPVSIAVLAAGTISGARYINSKSLDPYSMRFFSQKDVAVSRVVKDIVAGITNPSAEFKRNEFRKIEKFEETDFDIFVCQNLGYAITHVFLYPYGNHQILSFSDGLPYNLLNENQILAVNKRVIGNYQKNGKDLKLVWELTGKTERIVSGFGELKYLGTDEILTAQHEGQNFSLYILTVKSDNIDLFKDKIQDIILQ